MRALSSILGVALVTAAVVVGCSNRYAALCDRKEACAEEEHAPPLDKHGMTFEASCEATLPTRDDALSDACFDCLLNVPCDVVNDCNIRKSCGEWHDECAAVCP